MSRDAPRARERRGAEYSQIRCGSDQRDRSKDELHRRDHGGLSSDNECPDSQRHQANADDAHHWQPDQVEPTRPRTRRANRGERCHHEVRSEEAHEHRGVQGRFSNPLRVLYSRDRGAEERHHDHHVDEEQPAAPVQHASLRHAEGEEAGDESACASGDVDDEWQSHDNLRLKTILLEI